MHEKPLPTASKILYNYFRQQNTEKGHFDVEFCIGENVLYAHKHILWPMSTVFEKTFFGPWSTPNPSIKISEYSFETFKEFLTYFYIERCKITSENIVSLVDLAEYYHVTSLKDKCDVFLSKSKVDIQEVLHWFEFAQMYSLKLSMKYFLDIIRSNVDKVLQLEYFLNVKLSTIKALVTSHWLNISEEELFDSILKWAYHQQAKTSKSPNPPELRHQLSSILPFIRFPTMSLDYINHKQELKSLFEPVELEMIIHDASQFAMKKRDYLTKYPRALRCWR